MCTWAKQSKELIHYFPWGRQVISHFQESSHHTEQSLGKTNAITSNVPPFLPSSPRYVHWAWCPVLWGIPVASWGQLSWLSPHNFLCIPRAPTGGVGWEAEKVLVMGKHHSVISPTPNPSSQPHSRYCEEHETSTHEFLLSQFRRYLFWNPVTKT